MASSLDKRVVLLIEQARGSTQSSRILCWSLFDMIVVPNDPATLLGSPAWTNRLFREFLCGTFVDSSLAFLWTSEKCVLCRRGSTTQEHITRISACPSLRSPTILVKQKSHERGKSLRKHTEFSPNSRTFSTQAPETDTTERIGFFDHLNRVQSNRCSTTPSGKGALNHC